MGQKKAGISGKVMSLTTTQYLKTHERDYNPYRMLGGLFIENTVKAVAAYRFGVAEYDGSGHDAGAIAVDGGGGWQLSDYPALVSDSVGSGTVVVGSDTNAFARPQRGLSAGG